MDDGTSLLIPHHSPTFQRADFKAVGWNLLSQALIAEGYWLGSNSLEAGLEQPESEEELPEMGETRG